MSSITREDELLSRCETFAEQWACVAPNLLGVALGQAAAAIRALQKERDEARLELAQWHGGSQIGQELDRLRSALSASEKEAGAMRDSLRMIGQHPCFASTPEKLHHCGECAACVAADTLKEIGATP